MICPRCRAGIVDGRPLCGACLHAAGRAASPVATVPGPPVVSASSGARLRIKGALHPLVRDLVAAGVSGELVDRVGSLVWQAAEWAKEDA